MMKTLTQIYKPFDIVVVPFPFTDSKTTKRRPALVISSKKLFNDKSNHYVLCMITSSLHKPWPLDTMISELQETGLQADSIIRMKIFTLDQNLVLKKIGNLKTKDKKKVINNLESLFDFS